jgi:hypothetical protein
MVGSGEWMVGSGEWMVGSGWWVVVMGCLLISFGEGRMAGRVRSYRDLRVWQKGVELVKAVYALTRKFPRYETYGLSDQLRRSSVSVTLNIAEGQARQHTGEFR